MLGLKPLNHNLHRPDEDVGDALPNPYLLDPTNNINPEKTVDLVDPLASVAPLAITGTTSTNGGLKIL